MIEIDDVVFVDDQVTVSRFCSFGFYLFEQPLIVLIEIFRTFKFVSHESTFDEEVASQFWIDFGVVY